MNVYMGCSTVRDGALDPSCGLTLALAAGLGFEFLLKNIC